MNSRMRALPELLVTRANLKEYERYEDGSS